MRGSWLAGGQALGLAVDVGHGEGPYVDRRKTESRIDGLPGGLSPTRK